MLLSNRPFQFTSCFTKVFAVLCALTLGACQFQPLHGNNSASLQNGASLASVSVAEVNTRVAQQVRNHLLFILNGGNANADKTHEARIRVTRSDKQLAAIAGVVQDSTSGNVTVTASYDLVDLKTGKAVSNGTRQSIASYDRTGQVFANERAVRDAENRAAKEVAESLRLAIAADLNKL